MLSDARGKVLVLNLWATWCPPCVEEMPELVAFVAAHDPEKVSFLSLSCDDPALADTKLVLFRDQHALNFPVYVLNQMDDLGELDIPAYAAALKFDFDGQLPVTLLYGADGTTQHVWKGAITREMLEEAVAALL